MCVWIIGGVVASHSAWLAWKEKYGSPLLPGVNLTSEQLFWWGWARNWCEVARDDAYLNYTDVHAPLNARVWGVMQNNKAFADAYQCPIGSNMNPANKCILW